MIITITGGVYNDATIPDFWLQVENMIRVICGTPVPGRLMRISRRDHGHNYRSAGTYDLDYTAANGYSISVVMELK